MAQWVAQHGRLGPRDAVGWVVRVARTLEPLHSLGEAHGRISAEAVLVESADASGPGALRDPVEVPDPLEYHSADRAARGPDDAVPDDDVWALGVLLYYLLTASYPYPGASDEEIRARIGFRPPAPIALHGLRDDVLQCTVDRAFSTDTGLRLTHAGELRSTLLLWSPATRRLPPLTFGSTAQLGRAGNERTARQAREAAAIEAALADDAPTEGVEIEVPEEPRAATGAEPGRARARTPAARENDDAPTTQPSGSARDDTRTTPEAAPVAAPRPARTTRRGRWRPLAAALGLLAAGAGAAVAWLQLQPGGAATTPPAGADTAPTPSGRAGASPSGAGVEPVTSGAGSAGTSPSAPSASPAAPTDLAACVQELLPLGAFGGDARPSRDAFDFVCSERDPRRSVSALKALLVRFGPSAVTDAMREWSALGWYSLGGVAVVRARCCPGAAPLVAPDLLSVCELGPALARIGEAAVGGDDAVAGEAIQSYGRAVRCAATAGAAGSFTQSAQPDSNQAAVLLRVLGRARGRRQVPR
ncbi:MAG: hypothetical protein IT373_12105 [Polyangiaceae bacterium]|nr:hypothetical protein [Polyangiaceae bacterium]